MPMEKQPDGTWKYVPSEQVKKWTKEAWGDGPVGGGPRWDPFAYGGSQGREIGAFGPPPAGEIPKDIPVGSVAQGQELAAQYGEQARAAEQASSIRSTFTPRLGPAALEEVGPMSMQNRYGPGMLNHYGPNLGGVGVGPGGAPTPGAPGGPGGFQQAFQTMAPAMGMPQLEQRAQGMPNPFDIGGGMGGMRGLELAQLLATLASAGGQFYGQYKEGKQRDREYEDQKRRLDEDDERKEDAGRVFGEAFRQYARRG